LKKIYLIYILKDIKNKEYRLSNIYKSEFEKALYNNIKIASDLANKYKDL